MDETQLYFSNRLPLMTDAVQRLIREESPSNDIEALNNCAQVLSGMITETLGVAPRVLKSGPEKRPHLQVDLGDNPDVLLVGHFDTVHPMGAIADNPIRVEDGCLFGPGSLDMKGGIVMMIEIARRLQMTDARPNVTLFFNSDEEIGSLGSAPYLIDLATNSSAVLVFDYGDASRALRNGARGCRHLRVRATGKGGHAAYPERNRNPLEAIASLITAVTKAHSMRNDLSITATTIQAADKPNVVADDAEVVFDVRSISYDGFNEVEKFLNDFKVEGFEFNVECILEVTPFPVTEENAAVDAAIEASKQLGWEPPLFREARGASDANTVASVTTSILDGLGGWGDGAHSSAREYLDLESLVHFPTLATTISELILAQSERAERSA